MMESYNDDKLQIVVSEWLDIQHKRINANISKSHKSIKFDILRCHIMLICEGGENGCKSLLKKIQFPKIYHKS